MYTFVSCEEVNEGNPEVPGNLIIKTKDVFSGSIIESKSDNIDGIDVWRIKIENNKGSIVEFNWSKNRQDLVKLVGETAPFNYNINPGGDLLELNTALTVASSGFRNERLNSWKLEREDAGMGKWIYSFVFDEISRTVFVNALNGDVVRVN